MWKQIQREKDGESPCNTYLDLHLLVKLDVDEVGLRTVGPELEDALED